MIGVTWVPKCGQTRSMTWRTISIFTDIAETRSCEPVTTARLAMIALTGTQNSAPLPPLR